MLILFHSFQLNLPYLKNVWLLENIGWKDVLMAANLSDLIFLKLIKTVLIKNKMGEGVIRLLKLIEQNNKFIYARQSKKFLA